MKTNTRQLFAPEASSSAVASAMRGNTSRDTSPEKMLRRTLRESGMRGYRKNVEWLPGRPDIAFIGSRVAVFVHGCFWHSCPRCNIKAPKTNAEYWEHKLSGNVERDTEVTRQLEQEGWGVLCIWECEIHSSVTSCVDMIRQRMAMSSGREKVRRRPGE